MATKIRDISHKVEFTVGLKAIRHPDGTIKKIKGEGLWQTRPDWVQNDVRLLRMELEIPESFFGLTHVAKGRLESRLQEEFEVFMNELT